LWLSVFFILDALKYFFPVYGNLARCANTDAYLIAFHAKYSDGDIVTDLDRFAHSACQYKHLFSLQSPPATAL